MPRVKQHFKVHTSIRHHQKLAGVYQSNDLLALWVRLGVHAIESYADRTGDSFIVPDRQLMELTGKGRLDVARTWLRRLADVSPMCAEREGEVWRITFPNLAKKQGFGPRNGKESATPSSSSSASSSSSVLRTGAEPPGRAVQEPLIPDPQPEARGPGQWVNLVRTRPAPPGYPTSTDWLEATWERILGDLTARGVDPAKEPSVVRSTIFAYFSRASDRKPRRAVSRPGALSEFTGEDTVIDINPVPRGSR